MISTRSSTKFSPFELFYGRKPTLPFANQKADKITQEDNLVIEDQEEIISEEEVSNRATRIAEIFKQVDTNIKFAQQRY